MYKQVGHNYRVTLGLMLALDTLEIIEQLVLFERFLYLDGDSMKLI